MTREQWITIKEVVTGERTDTGITVRAGCNAAVCTVSEFNTLLRRSKEHRLEDEIWVWDVAETMEVVNKSRGMVFLDEMCKRAMDGWDETTSVNGVVVRVVRKKDNKYLERLTLHFNPDMRPAAHAQVPVDPNAPNDGKGKTFQTAEEAWEAMERLRNWEQAHRTEDDDVERILGERKMDA